MLNEQLRDQLEEKNKTIEMERQKFKELQDQVKFYSDLPINFRSNISSYY